MGAKAVYLVNDGFVLELIALRPRRIPPLPPAGDERPGLTHLSVAVADIAATLAKVEPTGARSWQDTDMGGLAIMIRDPDGQLIELTTFGFPDHATSSARPTAALLADRRPGREEGQRWAATARSARLRKPSSFSSGVRILVLRDMTATS